MAESHYDEARNYESSSSSTLPQAGKVEKVCQQWVVHEDQGLAHRLQDEEIHHHFGLNRYHRRTVRDDIPVAKLVQSDEEHQRQQERLQQLEVMKMQSEEDERIAKRVMADLDDQDESIKQQLELQDEEFARKMQEKEQHRFERVKEKQRSRELKKERQVLEQQLAIESEQARLVVNSTDNVVNERLLALESGVGGMNLRSSGRQNGHIKVTPAGHLEDNGDFSDFYIPPSSHMGCTQRKQLQQVQDEELARLLQEQEYKRTKAEVDRNKIRDIETRDAELARVMQEQEKIKLRKAKQRKQRSIENARRQQREGVAPLSHRSQSVEESRHRPPPLPPNHPSLRATASQPPPPVPPPIPTSSPPPLRIDDSYLPPTTSPGIPDFHSAHQPYTSRHNHNQLHHSNSEQISSSLQHPHHSQQRVPDLHSDLSLDDAPEVERWLAGSPMHTSSPSQNRRLFNSDSGRNNHHITTPSSPGSYHSDAPSDGQRSGHSAEMSPDSLSNSNGSTTFNIAMAIDPTYKRRQRELEQQQIQHEAEIQDSHTMLPASQSYPSTDNSDLEWDPSVRGSLRRPRGQWNPVAVQQSGNISDEEDVMDESWQPVQGQKRTTLDRPARKTKPVPQQTQRPPLPRPVEKKRSSCKQQ